MDSTAMFKYEIESFFVFQPKIYLNLKYFSYMIQGGRGHEYIIRGMRSHCAKGMAVRNPRWHGTRLNHHPICPKSSHSPSIQKTDDNLVNQQNNKRLNSYKMWFLYTEQRKPMSNTPHVAVSDIQICSPRINLLAHIQNKAVFYGLKIHLKL